MRGEVERGREREKERDGERRNMRLVADISPLCYAPLRDVTLATDAQQAKRKGNKPKKSGRKPLR